MERAFLQPLALNQPPQNQRRDTLKNGTIRKKGETMKKIIGIIFVSLMFANIGFAKNYKIKTVYEGKGVNDLLQIGFTLFDTEELRYHLIKGNELVTCTLNSGEVRCYNP